MADLSDGLIAALFSGQGPGLMGAQIVQPMARNWIPSKAEKEQTDLRRQEVKLKEQELEMRERHFLVQMEKTRENILLQLEGQQTNLEYQDELRRWPLSLSPISILRASKKRNSFSLNLIVCVVDTNDVEFYRGHGRTINQMIDALSNVALPIAEQVIAAFKNDMVCYRETLKTSRFVGDSLSTALSVLLQSEPTVLIQLRVLTEDRVGIDVSHWGMPHDTSPSFTRYDMQTINLPSLPVFLGADDVGSRQTRERQYQQVSLRRNVDVGVALAGLIVSIGDTFRTLQQPHTFPVPVLPSMMRDPTFGLLPKGSQVPDAMWLPLIATYCSVYDVLAGINRSLASKLAAMAAYTAWEAKQPDFANKLLDKALEFAGISSADAVQVMSVLRRQRTNNRPLELEKALNLIRRWPIYEGGSRQDLGELARQLGPLKGQFWDEG